jgi:diguanylate cyclase (GGDEF)-like protein
MIKTIPSQQLEYRQAFLRHLLKRIEAVEQRIQHYSHDGWDAEGMALLNDTVQRLTGASGRYNLIEASQHLLTLEQMLGEHIARKSLPDPQQSERMLALISMVATSLVANPDSRQQSAYSEITLDTPDAGSLPMPILAAVSPAPTATSKAAKPAAITPRLIYHLSDGNALALELGQCLATSGYEVDSVEIVDALSGLLASRSPQLVLIDTSRMSDLTAVGAACRDAQKRSHDQQRIQMVAMAAQDDLRSRLDARRAGVDVLLFPPFNATEISSQLQTLLMPVVEEKVRVLIVEDDRAQALFAQSVLTNAGIQAQVEHDPMHVLESLKSLQPDLVLMDLHMPLANGAELTALIREHPAFTYLPIVFLSGENDPDVRFDAINSGGDDFLTKPIRPKNLIAAVQNRVRRMRSLQQHQPSPGALDDATGLYRRAYVLDRINDALGTSSDLRTDVGGVLFLEIDDIAALRDRLGLVAVDELLTAAGRVLAVALGEQFIAASINDNAFLILAADLDESTLDALAQRLRDQLMQHPFEIGGKEIRLHASVGICLVHFGFGDASVLLDAAERACREARISEQGVKRHQPSKDAEPDQEAALIGQLREAISNDGFELIYQPIATVQGSQEEQYQTLLRMRDAGGKLLPAAEILPLVERAGLVIDIDRWVLTRAMSVVRQERDSGRAMRLFIPQSMATFSAADQVAWLKAALAKHELPGSALVLECRLDEALLNPPALEAFANAVRNDGVQLCLGQYEHTTDASSLLDRLPFGFIKLAPKYVASNATRDVRDELHMLIDRAHKLYIQVIGHRVEDTAVAATLWMSGIDYIQGNLVKGAASALDFDFNAAVL